jgi:trehalose 6-phosphate synthase
MLISLLGIRGGHWIFTAPPGAAGAGPVHLDGDVWLHPVRLEEQVRRHHYDTISIGLFLSLLHYMHDTSVAPVFGGEMRDAWAAYESVNRAYAERLADLAGNSRDDWILINDPHLMMVPEFLTEYFPRRASRLTYFLGTPWCEPDYFCSLPGWLRSRVLQSLLHCDLVGFHADRWAAAFVACCVRFLPGVMVSTSTDHCGRIVHVIRYRDRITQVLAEPFPVDGAVLEQMRAEDATTRWRHRLAGMAQGRRVLVRADRIDLWKNLLRGFAAYEQMLRGRPAMAGECWFAAIATPPSRASRRQRAYQDQAEAAVRRLNERFGAPGRDAVSLVYPGPDSGSRNCVVAALDLSHAALANPTYDGLNLFVKEAGTLMDDRAPLLLSVNAGAYQRLAPHVTALDPFDLEQTSVAMESALDSRNGGYCTHALGRHDLLRRECVTSWLDAVFPEL